MMTFQIYGKKQKPCSKPPTSYPYFPNSFHENGHVSWESQSPQASLIPWPKALPRLVARRCAVRRPQAGCVAVHGAAGGVAGVVAARQGGPGSHLHLGEVLGAPTVYLGLDYLGYSSARTVMQQ